MRIDANWSRPHGMRIERIRIQCELSQSTFGGAWFECELEVDWINLRDNFVIIH